MKKFGAILILLFYFLPFGQALAQTSAGFVPGDIWYSKEPFEEGDKIQIYTVIFNPDSREFSGTVAFFDNTTFLGKKDFVMGAKSVKDLYINWTVTVGDHKIFAKIQNAKFLISPGKYQDVYLPDDETQKSSSSVSKKITSENTKAGTSITSSIASSIINKSTDTLENAKDKIAEAVPEVVSTSVDSTTNSLDSLRSKVSNYSLKTKEEAKTELAELKKSEDKKSGGEDSSLIKPFKYIKLFFASLLYFVFHNKIVFYTLLSGIVFYIIRYIWRLFF